jgi:hypothetical protein
VNFSPRQYEQKPTVLVTLSAETQDGVQIDPLYIQQIFSENMGMTSPNFQGAPLDKVKAFHVWQRKIQWVTFSNLPAEPAVAPKEDVSPSEVAAAEAAIVSRQQAAQAEQMRTEFQAMEEKRKEWDKIPPDPTTPKGALRTLFEAADKGDIQGVRQRVVSDLPDPNHLLDLFAKFIADGGMLRATVAKRFGDGAMASLGAGNPYGQQFVMIDFELIIMNMDWQPSDGGGLQANDFKLIKRPDGQFYLDVSSILKGENQKQAEQYLRPLVSQYDKLQKFLADNPSATLAQFKDAMQALPTPVLGN